MDVKVYDDTVWLTQKQMAMLFETSTQNITLHIGNIYKEHELIQEATCKDFLQVQFEGTRKIQRKTKYFNLDVIISVGHRVKSIHGTRFRQWATTILKEYLLHGYSIRESSSTFILVGTESLPRRPSLVFHRTFIARRGRGCRPFRYLRLRYAHLRLLRGNLYEVKKMRMTMCGSVPTGHPPNNPTQAQ